MKSPSAARIAELTPEDLASATWDDLVAWYDALESAPLGSGAVEPWLRDWSRLEELLTEAASRAMIAYTADTTDEAKQADYLRFSSDLLPKADERSTRLARRLVDSGYGSADLATTLTRFRTQIEIFREDNVALFSEAEELGARYQQITGGITVNWNGEEKTLPQLEVFLRDPDRSIRERAFRLGAASFLERREELAHLFDRLFELREQVARNAGFSNFREYAFRAKCRFDYTAADCQRFHAAVERVVMPAVERVMERRRQRLGLDRLRPWDLQVDPEAKPALAPFRDAPELIGACERIFQRLDRVLARDFQTMIDEGLLDLETRKGKAPGGYCETLHYSGRPYIFMNAAGTVDDVMTLFHEGGHAFHAFAAHPRPLIWQRHPPMEAAELASMSMELFAARYLRRQDGGFFTPEEYRRAQAEMFEDILVTLGHVASVDAFQDWVYTSGEGGQEAARDAAWIRIRSRFERGVEWGGLEAERIMRWYRQLHIFLYPFYYIEYGIAQLGALQLWRNSLVDESGAVRAYRDALALGSTSSLPEIYRTAGARLIFDDAGMAELTDLVQQHLEALEDDGAVSAA